MDINKSISPFFRRIDEIDFLRALAVSGVVGSHIIGLKGGFVGVDIFFVISGYVITLSLLKENSSIYISLGQFYYRRLRRIIPPLFIVSVLIYILIEILIVDSDDYLFLIKSFRYQSFFAHNFFFAEQSAEYFHGLSEAKFNLHLWSIAVEEQFYIVFPLVFLFVYAKKNIFKIMLILLLLAFVSMLTFTMDQYGRYYLIYSRAWELLSGSVACLFSYYLYHRTDWGLRLSRFVNLNHGLIVVNLLIILSVMFSVHPSLDWPRWPAVLLVLSTAILIVQFHLFPMDIPSQMVGVENIYDRSRGLLSWVVNNNLLKYIGKSSYSIYLYHWPVFAALLYVDYDFGGKFYEYVIYFMILFLLSDVSYRFLEKNQQFISKKMAVFILFVFVLSCFCVSFKSFSDPADMSTEASQIVETGKFSDGCLACVESTEKDFIVLWGDSHARALVSAIEFYCKNREWDMVFIAPMPLINENKSHEKIAKLIKLPNYRGMVLASRWSMYLEFPDDEPEEEGIRYIQFNEFLPSNKNEAIKTFEDSYRSLFSAGLLKKAVVLLQVPRYPFFPVKEALLENKGLKFRHLPDKLLSQHKKEHSVVNEILNSVSSNDVVVVDPASILCPAGTCKWRDSYNLFYKDDDHLSVYGANLIMPLIETALANF